MATVEIPSFEFSAFYYQQILEALILYKRRYVPELTDESEFEPFIQLLRSFALVGHLNNVLVDIVANESTLPTARLAESVRNMLRLIAYELAPAAPSSADLVFELNRVLSSTTSIIPGGAQFATQRGTSDTPVITFEVLQGQSCPRTDQFGAVFAKNASGTFVDHTTNANAGTPFTVWNEDVEVGSELYFGHENAMFDVIDIATSGGGSITVGVWEFYDGDINDTKPDAVTNLGAGILQFDITNLLGPSKRSGALVTVTYSPTGFKEEAVSSWSGTNNIVTVGLLGQSSPSLDLNDYVVGVYWQEMANVVDGTLRLSVSGAVEFDLPHDLTRSWQKADVDDFEGFFIRFRVVECASIVSPSVGLCRMDTGAQYLLAEAIQGKSIRDEVLGSSNGEANQRFAMKQIEFILGSDSVFVDAVQWIRVENFLSSLAQDTHYRIELGEDNRASVVFGNGVTGKIPQIGLSNITVDYRHNAEEDGNVGSNTIVVDKTGLTFVNKLWNPRAAVGWREAQSATQEGLEQAKIEGPATLRTKNVAISPNDMEALTVAFVSEDGEKPFVRARAFEEGFGPKTIKIVCVTKNGGVATTQQLEDLSAYLNGDRNTDPPLPKRIVANQQAVPVSYTPRVVNVTALVEAPSTVAAQQVVNRLIQVLRPESLEDDGVTFAWDFGSKIPYSRISHEIFETDPKITDVDLTFTDIQLAGDELPVPGTISITIVESL